MVRAGRNDRSSGGEPVVFLPFLPFPHTSRRSFATPPSQTPTLHLDSYRHSPSRCNTVVTINMYTKAIALAILAVAGVQAQSDYDYE